MGWEARSNRRGRGWNGDQALTNPFPSDFKSHHEVQALKNWVKTVLRWRQLTRCLSFPIKTCVLKAFSLTRKQYYWIAMITSVQFSSVAQSCPTLWDPVNHRTPGLPVHHQLLESTQTHVHWVGDAIQPSHLLSSPSPPALNFSQHQGLFKWVSSLHQVAKVLVKHLWGA